MLEKLSLRELIRYFLSGVVVEVVIVADTLLRDALTLSGAVVWLRSNAWASSLSVAALAAVLTLLIGYMTFTVYRAVFFDVGILYFKIALAKIGVTYDYRVLIQEDIERRLGSRIGGTEAERVYRTVRGIVAPEYYREAAPDIHTGLHFMYLASLVALLSQLFGGHWVIAVAGVALFALTFLMDLNHERDELDTFLLHHDELKKEIAILVTDEPLARRVLHHRDKDNVARATSSTPST